MTYASTVGWFDFTIAFWMSIKLSKIVPWSFVPLWTFQNVLSTEKQNKNSCCLFNSTYLDVRNRKKDLAGKRF